MKEKAIKVCLVLIGVFGISLLTLLNVGNEKYKAESEEQTAGTSVVIENWYPGKLSEDGLSQEIPELESKTPHDRFKELCSDYGISASKVWEVENKYNIREGVLLGIMIAETSGGKKGYGVEGCRNVGNVDNNDRGDRRCYGSFDEGLDAIGRALNGTYLKDIQTLGCLSNAGSCNWWEDNGHRYASSNGNRERTMVNVLSGIYGEIDASKFNVRRTYTLYE